MSNENLKHDENCRAYAGQAKKLIGEKFLSGEFFNGKMPRNNFSKKVFQNYVFVKFTKV